MKNRPVPRTKFSVSPICLGTMTFGTPVARDEAIAIIHHALDHGVNFIDTADIYEGYARVLGSPGGVAESIVGDALVGRRDKAIVTTKVGNPVGQGADDTGLGRAHILHQIDASLRRMKTDYVDLYELHRPDPNTPLETSVGVMAELVRVGKVRHWGFSNFDAAHAREMLDACDRHGWARPVVSQPKYNWLDRAIEADHLPLCRAEAIAVTPYQPLQAGVLTGKYRRGEAKPANSRAAEHSRWLAEIPDEMFDRVEAFEREAASLGRTPTQHAIRWVLDQPGISSVVVGVKSTSQLDEAIRAAE